MKYDQNLKVKETVAVVVTYNRKGLLTECIDALLSSSIPVSILIIDNASTDGTKELISEKYENDVIYINTGQNLGGAGGFSFGIKYAAQLICKYLWILDDDTIVRKDTLSKLMSAGEKVNYNFGWLSSLALWKDGSACVMNTQELDPYWGEEAELVQENIIRSIRASFVSLLVPKEIVLKIGLPYKEYFIWGDDVEYTLRISKSRKCYFIMNSVVEHKMKDNQGTADFLAMTDPKRVDRMYYAYRNGIHTAREKSKKSYYGYLYSLYKRYRKISSSDCALKKEKLAVIKKAIHDGIRFKPQIEYVRESQ